MGEERRLTVLDDHGNVHVVEKDRLFVIGRSSPCSMVVDREGVGRQHAAIRFRDGEYWLEDYGSELGTIRGSGERLTGPALIRDGDEFSLGGARVRFSFR